MKVSSLIPTSAISFDTRYTVYLSEIKKRFAYIGLSFLIALICAYTQRNSLMYSMTLSLQKALHEKERTISILNNLNASSAPVDEEISLLSSTKHVQDLYVERDASIRLIFTDVEEAFYTLLFVSLFWCVCACLPVLLYQILCFSQPGLYAWQSRRVWLFISARIFFACLVFKLVDLYVIPRLLRFFYSFQIQRNSLCLDAETKVISYISLYVFVYFMTLIFLVLIGVWSFYKQRQILRSFTQNQSVSMNAGIEQPGHSLDQESDRKNQYQSQRGKVWWGCLLMAALLSPPELVTQLVYAFFLLVCTEISVWLAYSSSCRLRNKMY